MSQITSKVIKLAHKKFETQRECISIIGDFGDVEENKRKNFQSLFKNLMKYLRSSSDSIICSSRNRRYSFQVPLLKLIDQNIKENPYYSRDDNNYKPIQLIKVDSSENLVRCYFKFYSKLTISSY